LLWHAPQSGPWDPCHAASGCFRASQVSRMNKRRTHPRKSEKKRGYSPGELSTTAREREGQTRKKKKKSRSTRSGCTDQLAARTSKFLQPNISIAGAGTSLSVFWLPSSRAFSSFPLRLQKFIRRCLLLAARRIILQTYRALQHNRHHHTPPHNTLSIQHYSSPVSHNTSDLISIIVTTYLVDPMSAAIPLI
jgi:hypothetical protein